MKYLFWSLIGIAIVATGVAVGAALLQPSSPQEDASSSYDTVLLYYYDEERDKDATGNINCSTDGLVPVTRTLDVSGKTRSEVMADTLQLLLEGRISMREEDEGLVSNFPIDGVALNGVLLEGDDRETARLNFSDLFGKSSGGSCRVSILRAQITATAKQFSGVETVVIEPEDIFQP